jgi:hypothetical protein
VWEESGQEGELTNFRVYGMSQAYTMVQALQSAGRNPTRDDLVAAVEQAGSEWEGPGFSPFRYSEDKHAGYSGVLVSRITGTAAEDLTPVLVTDNGDAEIEELDREATTPPESGIPDEDPIN